MEPVSEALRLLKRKAVIENKSRSPGGIEILEERELFDISERASRYPASVQAILLAARQLHRSIDDLSVQDVERFCDVADTRDLSSSPASC